MSTNLKEGTAKTNCTLRRRSAEWDLCWMQPIIVLIKGFSLKAAMSIVDEKLSNDGTSSRGKKIC